MKIFLTGSAGYVGSHVLIELLKSNHSIWNVDNFSNSSPQSFARVEAFTGVKLILIASICWIFGFDQL